MKKSGSVDRPYKTNTNRRTENAGGKSKNSHSQQNRSGAKQRHDNLQQWLSASSSQTLTSHLSMTSNGNRNNNNSNSSNGTKNESRNGTPRNNPKSQQKNRFRSRQDNKPRNNNDRPFRSNPEQAQNDVKPQTQVASTSAQTGSASLNPDVAKIDAFELFCAYHLGIRPDNQYRQANINEVARRFNASTGVIKQASKEYGMDPAALLDKDFDMAMAQLDIQVAPEGIDRKELAKSIYEEFLAAPIQKRNWKKILEEDAKENRKVFGD
ncbi:MAG: hypothetical protein COV66_00110 [Nitrospinae bacterium CG11_big_fil_rev_8_21_14_0_20_45_15]|nr:MAG: hypothetical protein COV66_00110 [Nitrospinae bacterium CG11_big_fil_rev_8_21_14_0_20_45_15]